MNTNEFYKELFERYAIDQEKIRLEAIKQAKTPAWKRVASNYWKPAAGIAAAVAVTVGTVAYTASGSSDLNITISPETALSASQRLYDAEQSYYNASAEKKSKVNVYVTFMEPTSYSDMSIAVSAVPDGEGIEVDALYLTDGTVLRDREDIELFAEMSGSDKDIAAAKLIAFSNQYRDIQDLTSVYLAELGSAEINDDTFVPMEVDDSDPLIDDISYITDAPVTVETPITTTTAFSFEQETTVPTEETSEAITTAPVQETESDVSDDTTAPVETTDDTAGVPEETSGDETTVSETDAAEETTAEITDETTAPVSEPAETTSVTVIDNTDVVGLMTEVYKFNIPNSLETLLAGDKAVILTKNEVYFCDLGRTDNDDNIKMCEIASPKIAYASNKTIVISGCNADGQRNRMLVFNPENGFVSLVDAAANIGISEIGTINYSPACDKFFLKTISSSETYVYELTVDELSNMTFRPLFELSSAVSVAGYNSGKLYFTASENNVFYSLYSFDCTTGETVMIETFDSACRIKRSPYFDCFMVIPASNSVTYVFNAMSEKLVPVDISADADITTYGGSIYFSVDNEVYVLDENCTVVPSAGFGAVFRNGVSSELTLIEANSEGVSIANANVNKWR